MNQTVLVCGGRYYANYARLVDVLDAAHATNPIVKLIHGGSTGADAMADAWAKSRGVRTVAFKAAWRSNGRIDRSAGPRRNQRMIDEGRPDLVIAFPGERGTADMVRRARAAGIPVDSGG